MKISSASKKVLASALSAAMVVAFSPAVALAVNNGYDEVSVEHHFDAGTVTVAPSCEGDGLMTYKCKDGDNYTVIAAIKSTEKHVYSANPAYTGNSADSTDGWGDADANGFVWAPDNTAAKLVLKCSGHKGNTLVNATVTKSGTAPTFSNGGEVTYTATAADEYGKVYTSTKTVKSDAYSVAGGIYVAKVAKGDYEGKGVDWTDGYGVARITIANGNADEAQTLTATTTSKPEPRASESDSKTRYTAEFELPAGVLFADKKTNVEDKAKFYVNTKALFEDSAVKEAYIKGGKLVVEAVYDDDTATTSHLVATGATATSSQFSTDANGAEQWSDNGVTVTYTGEGKIADGTARANGVWTIETKCIGSHTTKVVTAKTFADKVTKASCVKNDSGTMKETTVYTIEYSGGTFDLTVVNDSSEAATHHDYVAGETQWSYDGSNFTATTEYYCPVEGKDADGKWNERYTVTMTTNGDKSTGTANVEHNGSGVTGVTATATVANKSVKATSIAAGTVDVSMTLKKGSGVTAEAWAAVTDAIGENVTASLTGVDPKVATGTFTATSNFVEKSAKAAVMVQGTDGVADTKTYDLTSEHKDATVDSNGTITAGYTEYSAAVTLPEGVKKLTGAQVSAGSYVSGKWVNDFQDGKSIYQNADGSYTVKYRVADKVTVICDGAVDAEGFLPTEAAKWTVTDASGDKSATYVATAVATADIAHTKANPKQQKAYTITYGSGKTVVVNATGKVDAHKLSLKTFDYAVSGSDSSYTVTITPKLVCSDCGAEVNGEPIDGGTYKTADEAETALVKKHVYYNAGGATPVDLGEFVFTGEAASNTEFTAAPVFKWTSNVTDAGVVSPSVTATFTSADGKKEVVLSSKDGQIKVELVDAATSTYKATINAKSVPAGYKGTLTDTKVVSLHDGHSMVLEKVQKATTSKSGYAQYYCNNDGKAYKVVIAKDDVKVTPSKKTFKYSAVKKAKKTVTVKVANAKGKVSYKSSSKKVTVSKKGVVTVKKGTKKGTYKVTVTSKATDTYAKATKTVKIVVK